MPCLVEVAQGVLQGKECRTFLGKKYYKFEGIPYAKPPLGRLRFKAPEEPESWEGVRDATKPGNKCCQLNPYSSTPLEGSEDCLFLNVYTPKLPQEKLLKLPVIFFVHGGRLIFGHGHYYKPDYLIRHDVILVTINYRLHILGFLCLNIPEVPGNAGLKDTIMALKWVNKNIKSFNGDPDNITVMGESAGAGIVGSYLTSKMADGLFHKVIAQSGVPSADLYMVHGEDPIEKAKVVVTTLGMDLVNERSIYEFLLDTPIEDLVIAFSAAEMRRPPSVINAFFLPVVEKKFENVEQFFEEYPRIDLAANRFKKVPFLTGMCSHEAALFLQHDELGNIVFENDFSYFVPRYLNVKVGDKAVTEIEKKLRKFYFNDHEVTEKMKVQYIDMCSDRYFNFDIIYMAEMLGRYYPDVYLYKFQFSGNLNTRVMKGLNMKGACHGDMIQYQFYRKAKHDLCSPRDTKIVNMLSEAWCNFAKRGKPEWSGHDPKWLPYSPINRQTLVIDDSIQLFKNLDCYRLFFWLSIMGDYSSSKL